MSDVSKIKPDKRLPHADRAVKYLLDLIQHDPDLHHAFQKQQAAFKLLCEADAWRTGAGLDDVVRKRSEKKFTPWTLSEIGRLRNELRDLRDNELQDRLAVLRIRQVAELLDNLRTTLLRQMDDETVPPVELRALVWRIEDVIGRGVEPQLV